MFEEKISCHKSMTYKEHAVDIMDVSMLPPTIMNIVFGHRYFGTVEHGGLNSKLDRISIKKNGRLFTSVISFQM